MSFQSQYLKSLSNIKDRNRSVSITNTTNATKRQLVDVVMDFSSKMLGQVGPGKVTLPMCMSINSLRMHVY